MGRTFAYVISFIIAISLLGGCKTKKLMLKKEKTASKAVGLVKEIEDQELDYQSLEVKYSTRAELDGAKYALNITYRNIINEKLWMSVRAMLGIEAARMYADRDSVWIISRVGQFKEKGSWADMSKLVGYPLDFMAFQGILARKVFYPGREDKTLLQYFMKKENGNGIKLVADYNNQQHRDDAELFGFMPQFVVDGSNRRLYGTRLAPEDSEWMVDITYDRESVENMGLGNVMKIKGVEPEAEIELDLKIQGVSIDQALKFPFQWF